MEIHEKDGEQREEQQHGPSSPRCRRLRLPLQQEDLQQEDHHRKQLRPPLKKILPGITAGRQHEQEGHEPAAARLQAEQAVEQEKQQEAREHDIKENAARTEGLIIDLIEYAEQPLLHHEMHALMHRKGLHMRDSLREHILPAPQYPARIRGENRLDEQQPDEHHRQKNGEGVLFFPVLHIHASITPRHVFTNKKESRAGRPGTSLARRQGPPVSPRECLMVPAPQAGRGAPTAGDSTPRHRRCPSSARRG
jgi:hypothetical protein